MVRSLPSPQVDDVMGISRKEEVRPETAGPPEAGPCVGTVDYSVTPATRPPTDTASAGGHRNGVVAGERKRDALARLDNPLPDGAPERGEHQRYGEDSQPWQGVEPRGDER